MSEPEKNLEKFLELKETQLTITPGLHGTCTRGFYVDFKTFSTRFSCTFYVDST